MNISLKDRIIGAWALVSYEQATADGKVYAPLGDAAEGFIYYLPDGHVSVHIMDVDRIEFIPETIHANGKVRYSDLGYLAYAGRYQIDEERKLMVHRVEVSLYPEWIGGNQVRRIELFEDELRLSSYESQSDGVHFRLRWKRIQ